MTLVSKDKLPQNTIKRTKIEDLVKRQGLGVVAGGESHEDDENES